MVCIVMNGMYSNSYGLGGALVQEGRHSIRVVYK